MITPRVGVGAVVFRDGKVLLVQRKNEPGAGQWAIPGGKLVYGETLKQAAEREILEETGVRINAGDVLHVFELFEPVHYVIIDLNAEYVSGEPRAADDALDARWVAASELTRISVHEQTLSLLKTKCNFPATFHST